MHLDNVISGGAKDPVHGDFVVQSRKMLGYVQISPSSILVPEHVFAELLNFQNGSLGGPVDCIIDIANSKQTMRIGRVDVNPANGRQRQTHLCQRGAWLTDAAQGRVLVRSEAANRYRRREAG